MTSMIIQKCYWSQGPTRGDVALLYLTHLSKRAEVHELVWQHTSTGKHMDEFSYAVRMRDLGFVGS